MTRALTSKTLADTEYQNEADMIELLLVLARAKKRIFQITIGAAIVAAIISLLIPKMYTATTTILPQQQNESAVSSMLGQLAPLSGLAAADELGLKNPADLFIAMLKSRTIEDRLIDRFDLRKVYGSKRYQDARKELASRSEIIADKGGLISIAVTDRDPARSTRTRQRLRGRTSCAQPESGRDRSRTAAVVLSAKT